MKNILFTFTVLSLTMLSGCNYTNYISVTNLNKIKPVTLGLIIVPGKDRVDLLDMETNRVTSDLKTNQGPSSLAASPNNNLILVSNAKSGNVSAFFKSDNNQFGGFKKLGDIGSGINPVGVAFNPNPNINEAYIVYQGDSKIVFLDTKNKDQLPQIKYIYNLQGYSPKKIAVSSDGNKIYITDTLSGKLIILKIDVNPFIKSEITLTPELEKIADTDKLEGIIIDNPITLEDSKNNKVKFGSNRVFIANHAEDSIVVLKDDKVETTISLRDSTIDQTNKIGPKNMAIYRNPNTKIEKLYITGNTASVVSVIDLKTLKLIKNIPLINNLTTRNAYNPVGIANGILASKEEIMYVTNTSGYGILMINTNTDSLKRNFSGSPYTDPGYGEMITIF